MPFSAWLMLLASTVSTPVTPVGVDVGGRGCVPSSCIWIVEENAPGVAVHPVSVFGVHSVESPSDHPDRLSVSSLFERMLPNLIDWPDPEPSSVGVSMTMK